MDCHVVFAPDLQVNAQDFVAAWNDSLECSGLAEARLILQPPQDFPLDPQLLQQGLVLLAGFAGGIISGALKDVLKDKLTQFLKKKPKEASVKVESIRQPGGAYLIVVTKEGE